MSAEPPPIGGYFELELPAGGELAHRDALAFQSARAAFAALLAAVRPQAVWMPALVCDAMLQPLRRAGIAVRFYGIDERFAVDDSVRLRAGELILHVDYFGTCRSVQNALLERFPRDQVVADLAQAFYAPPRDCLASIYSPRKFFGIPDGGLLATQVRVDLPAEEDSGSAGRLEHLLLRYAGAPEDGYAAFRRAEGSLDDVTPRRMSAITRRLLGSIDSSAARRQRTANFAFLHGALGKRNELPIDGGAIDGPLCYPLLGRPGLRERLLRERVFVPTYWPEAAARVGRGRFESRWIERGLPLPCDQRYTPGELRRIVDLVDAAS
jgi:hypothetical protein